MTSVSQHFGGREGDLTQKNLKIVLEQLLSTKMFWTFEAPFLYLDINAKDNFHIKSYEFHRHQY